MEACIDTFSSVFGGGGGAAVEYRNPSRNASSPFTHQTFENSQFSNGGGHYSHHPHHQPQMQVPSSQSNSGIAMFQNSNDDYHHIQAMSWTDRSLLNSGTNNSKICDDGGGGTTTATLAENHHHHHHHLPHHPHHNHQSFHPIHPFGPPPPGANDGVSAAFNLQQLHQGICSVGSVPSWQQPYKFTTSNDCALPSVPTNEDGNDMKRSSIPMPLSMSRDPNTNTTTTTTAATPTTQQSNNFLNINHPCSSTTNGGGDDDDDSQQRFLDHVLNNMQCSTPNNTDHVNTVKNTISSAGVTDNNYGASLNTSSEIPPQLNFSSAHLNNGCQNNISRSPQHSPLPPPCSSSYAVSAADATTTSSLGGGGNPSEELTTDFVKMATTPTRHVRLRTNTRMDMDRLKAQEEDKRERELQKEQTAIRESKAVPVSIPPAVNVVVPSQVLQVLQKVTSALENPTPFHVEQKRKFNIKQYCAGITNSLPDVQGASSSPLGGGGGGSLTTQPGGLRPLPAKHNRLTHLITDGTVSSAPPNYSTTPAPVSPISVLDQQPASSPGPSQRSSVATSVNDEFEDSILDLLLDEKSGDQVASLPQTAFNRISGVPEGSSSCPADSTKDVICIEGPVKVSKDRIKKDNHNKIERKRRFHINDMITEQGKLLPKPNERHHEKIGEVKQNKGSILKASVDYTRVLKQDNELLHQKLVKAEEERKQLLLRLQHVEQLCKQNGVQIPEDIMTWKTGNSAEDLANLLGPTTTAPSQVRIKQEPMASYTGDDFDRNICDMMDEDRSIVTGNNDPMFGQPVVEADDGFHHPEGMDFND